MTGELSPIDKAKFVAAKRATRFVETGMRVGLGTGSTAAWLVQCLGEMVRDEGLRIKGVPTSSRTAQLAREVGIDVISLDDAKWLDVTIDGADIVEAQFFEKCSAHDHATGIFVHTLCGLAQGLGEFLRQLQGDVTQRQERMSGYQP